MRGAARSLARVRSLSSCERRLAIESVWLMAAAAVAHRVFGIQRAVALLSRARVGALVGPLPADRVAAIVNGAGLAFKATCLTRSVALHAALTRRGMDSHVIIGVARQASGFTAHAWVESHGRVAAGCDAAGFAPVWRSNSPVAEDVA